MTRFALLACVALAGCISFGPKPPPSLLTLDATAVLPAGATQSSVAARSVTITVPVVPAKLATTRVPVQSTGTSIAYLKDAVWVEQPARLFARLVSDTIAVRTGRIVLDPRQFSLDPGTRLTGELRDFGIDAASQSAIVTFDAAIARGDGTTVEKRRFEARVPLTIIEPTAAGIAINQAANQVAGEVADWIGR